MMTHAFNTLAPTSALVFALGLMAFAASAAQAEPGAYWLANGVDIGTTLFPEIQAKNNTAHITILMTVGKTPMEFLCLEFGLKGARLHDLGSFTGKIHYNSCVTILNKNGTPVGNCKPHSPGAPAGLIETNALEGLIKLHTLGNGAKDELLELDPQVGTAFFTLEVGALCAIGNKFDITGRLFLEEGSNESLIDKSEHLLEEGPLSELSWGTNRMTIDGSFWMFLIGAHGGMTFAGHAP